MPAPELQLDTTGPADEHHDEDKGPRITFGRVIVGLIVLASFAVWGYAYSGRADRVAPDTYDDPTFAVLAEPICADAKAAVEALPNALDAVDNIERADQIRDANAIYTTMLNQLAEEMTGTDRDRGITELWINRWRLLLSDRSDYADRLQADPQAIFYLSAEAGRRPERSITYVADTNLMFSCGAPTDVG